MVKPIANIVFENNLVNHTEVDYINYHKDPVDLAKIDFELPTLFVGWDYFKRKYISQYTNKIYSILEKKIVTNLLYWEFSFKENKSQHINGIDDFLMNAPEYYFSSNYRYTNLDPVMFSISDEQELFTVLNKKFDTVYKLQNKMVYLLMEDSIVGIDLTMYEFFNFNIESLISKFSASTTNYINDEDGSIYESYYKIFPTFDNLKRYLPVLVSNS